MEIVHDLTRQKWDRMMILNGNCTLSGTPGMHDGNLIIAEWKPLRVSEDGQAVRDLSFDATERKWPFCKAFRKKTYPPPPTPVPLHPTTPPRQK